MVLAADRRITKVFPSGKTELVEDESCKVVMIASAAVAGYTGLANLPEPPEGQTDLWLLEALSYDEDVSVIQNRLREWAIETFSHLKHISPIARRHAFVVTGWCKDRRGRKLRPFYSTVTNALERSGRWRAKALNDFEIRMEGLPRTSPFRLNVAGHPLSPEIRHELYAILGSAENRKPHLIASLLGQAIRATAAESVTVGANLLISVLPRASAAETGQGVRMGPDVLYDTGGRPHAQPQEGPVSYYVSADQQTAVQYGPHLVDKGGRVFGSRLRMGGPVPTDEQIRDEYESERRRLDVHQEQIARLKARLSNG